MRTAILSLATAAALCAGPGRARADQCAWVSDDAADRGARELARASKVIEYCEPCGDAAPGEPADVGTVSIRAVDPESSEVLLDERGIDLAYTYVLAPGAREYRNLAALAGCPAEGVSPTLRIDAATTSGVIITSDPTPVPVATPAPPAAFAPAALPPPAPAPRWEPVAPRPHVIVVAGDGSLRPALFDLLLGATLFANALLLMALFRRRFRTGAALPRATRLVDRD